MKPIRIQEIVAEIYRAIDRANELRADGQRLVRAEETVLYGPEGLDSLGLVSLILDVEAAVNERLGTQLVLADARAMARRENPFRDVRTLADYVAARVAEARPCPTNPSR